MTQVEYEYGVYFEIRKGNQWASVVDDGFESWEKARQWEITMTKTAEYDPSVIRGIKIKKRQIGPWIETWENGEERQMGTSEIILREAYRKLFRFDEALLQEALNIEEGNFETRSEDEINTLFDEILNDIKAKAWQEGRESLAQDSMNPRDSNGFRETTLNPYKNDKEKTND